MGSGAGGGSDSGAGGDGSFSSAGRGGRRRGFRGAGSHSPPPISASATEFAAESPVSPDSPENEQMKARVENREQELEEEEAIKDSGLSGTVRPFKPTAHAEELSGRVVRDEGVVEVGDALAAEKSIEERRELSGRDKVQQQQEPSLATEQDILVAVQGKKQIERKIGLVCKRLGQLHLLPSINQPILTSQFYDRAMLLGVYDRDMRTFFASLADSAVTVAVASISSASISSADRESSNDTANATGSIADNVDVGEKSSERMLYSLTFSRQRWLAQPLQLNLHVTPAEEESENESSTDNPGTKMKMRTGSMSSIGAGGARADEAPAATAGGNAGAAYSVGTSTSFEQLYSQQQA